MDDSLVKKLRVLTLGLIFSGALNIGLLASIIFVVLQENKKTFSVLVPAEGEKKVDKTNNEWIDQMAKLSFRELVAYLTDKSLVEEGYSKRDLAVAALVGFHHFNLEKALSFPLTQKRYLHLEGEQKIEIFPGLTDEQFEAIVQYAYQEKWPLTPQGLYLLLGKVGLGADESLVQAFIVTPEFYALQVLFQKTEAPQENGTLLQLIAEGNWDLLERFSNEQAQMLDLSVEKRRRLLLSYLALQSSTAAQLLLTTDFLFASKKLDDRGILDILALLKDKSGTNERFCIELLRSPRSDSVWQMAARRLYLYAGEPIPSPLDPKGALDRFAPQSPSPAPVVVTAAIPQRVHVVKEGDNLWKIARQYKIKVDELVKLNCLEKDMLLPGMTLALPDIVSQGTGSEPPR